MKAAAVKKPAAAPKGQAVKKNTITTAKKPADKAVSNAFAGAGAAMGAGIDALFAQDDLLEFPVSLDDIEIVDQVREEFESDDQGLAELGDSLAKFQIQAILLRLMPAGHPKPYRLVAGERRVRAAKLKGASLVGAKLQGAILTRASLIDADLSGANLDQAIFLNTQTEGCIGCP